jgi:hypothetical protein
MKAILVDFDTERLKKLEQMKSTTGKERNPLIRLAVDFLFAHPDEWPAVARDNNTYPETGQEPPAGTA